ncbi:Uncharacterized protein OBRU01_21272 [Operophtera brumata]|uniref:Uncharacterized protein n=1 Tax=Operophtera brumata TaxID=104452 RepID=A0A0L7KSZ0_OPEBR|nr:Uncharacterized protein OBRU01_21272 [Operophtera brumata]
MAKRTSFQAKQNNKNMSATFTDIEFQLFYGFVRLSIVFVGGKRYLQKSVSIMAGIKQVRNKKLLPDMSKEGVFTKDINLCSKEKHGVPSGCRLYSHHTLASSTERFADKEDLYLQPETLGCPTWRRLRNSYDKHPPLAVALGHPMKRGGIKECKSPFSVKLMNSGVHSSQTNPGYSRQPAGGAIFFY